MFTLLALSALLGSSLVRADVTPLTPSPGAVYNEGSTCNIAWTPDTTGAWNTTNIELMTGNNLNMIHLTTVATVDGISTSTYSYPCPSVTPNSAIYFYQFTSPNSPDRLWTGRFAIASTTGNTVPPSESTQPNGEAIPWGTGALVNPADAVSAPPYLSGNTTATNSSTSSLVISAAAASTSPVAVSSPISTPNPTLLSTTSESSAPPSATATASESNANGAMGGLVVDARAWHSAFVLGAAAFFFTVFL